MSLQRQWEEMLKHANQRLVLKSGAKPSELLCVYKKFLKVEEHRLRMSHRAGASGREVAHNRAKLVDVLLRHLFGAADAHCRQQRHDEACPLALVALGGYGRSELSPFSDVDIMFLHGASRVTQRPGYLDAMVEQVLYMLWDIGWKVGHSTRSIPETITQANTDMQSKTALIESRLLIGDAALYEKFRHNLAAKCVRGHEVEYIAARLQDQKERHEKFGDSVFMQEPNVKNGCGGLRDFQNLIWMAFFKYGVLSLPDLRQRGLLEPAEQRQLEHAYDFILRTRHSLHYHAHRACDVIRLAIQPDIASDLGYRQHDVLRRTEAFMRDYYTHARNVFLLTSALAERMSLALPTPSRLSAVLRRRGRREERMDGFILCDGILHPGNTTVFREEPERLIRVFRLAQQRQAEFSPALRTLVRQNLRWVDRSFRASAEVRDLFWDILQHKGQVARILRRMHETEFLGKFLPEFGRLTCLVQHEFFHRYTADEHTLQAIEHLDRILDAETAPHANYRKLFQQLEHPHVLYLAILVHDIGKAANAPRHAEVSTETARKIAARLRLGEDETAQLVFLVRNHLKLSLLSQRRDLDDQSTIDAVVRIAKDEPSLDALMLLTFADGIGTSFKTWSDWKDALLWGLYHRTKQEMTGTAHAKNVLARRIEQLYREVSKRMHDKLPLEEIYAHFELMPASYYIHTSAEEIIHHLMLLHRFFARQQEVESAEDALVPVIEWQPFPTQGFSRVTLCTWDRLGLFSRICGSLVSAELNVLSAHIYTRGDHAVLDIFEVCDRDLAAVTDEKNIQTANTALERVLTDREPIDFRQLLSRMRAVRGEFPPLREVTIPTLVEFDNEISKSRTVIEVQTEDRLGLIYALTRTITDLGLDISFAKISTEKGAAIDTFYVQDQQGNKITDPGRLATIKSKLESAIQFLTS